MKTTFVVVFQFFERSQFGRIQLKNFISYFFIQLQDIWAESCVKFHLRMLLRLSRCSLAAHLTPKRFNSSIRASFAVREPSLSSSSHQTTKDDQSTLPIFENALRNNSRIAVKDHNAEYTYKQLLTGASKISEIVSALCGKWDAIISQIVRHPNLSNWTLRWRMCARWKST